MIIIKFNQNRLQKSLKTLLDRFESMVEFNSYHQPDARLGRNRRTFTKPAPTQHWTDDIDCYCLIVKDLEDFFYEKNRLIEKAIMLLLKTSLLLFNRGSF